MSRGRVGLIKAIKEVFREVKFFGDAEISTLKKDLEAHKLQLEQLKQTRLERQRREEALALLEMRKAVEHLQMMEGKLAEQEERLEEAAEDLAQKAGRQQEAAITARAMQFMQGMDLSGLDLKEALESEEALLRQQLDRLKAELEAAGRGLPSPTGLPDVGAPSGSSGGRQRR